MDVLVSQNFVGDPVEDVENEEGQREDGSGDGVDAFRTVHEALAEFLLIVYGVCDYWRWSKHGGSLHSDAILVMQVVTQSITSKVKTTAVPNQFLFLWRREEKKKTVSTVAKCHSGVSNIWPWGPKPAH